MLLRLVLLSFFRGLLGFFEDLFGVVFRISSPLSQAFPQCGFILSIYSRGTTS
jgi:hypothetical protein